MKRMLGNRVQKGLVAFSRQNDSLLFLTHDDFKEIEYLKSEGFRPRGIRWVVDRGRRL
jgi:hypothetical protein